MRSVQTEVPRHVPTSSAGRTGSGTAAATSPPTIAAAHDAPSETRPRRLAMPGHRIAIRRDPVWTRTVSRGHGRGGVRLEWPAMDRRRFGLLCAGAVLLARRMPSIAAEASRRIVVAGGGIIGA